MFYDLRNGQQGRPLDTASDAFSDRAYDSVALDRVPERDCALRNLVNRHARIVL